MENKINHSIILAVEPDSFYGNFFEHMSNHIKISEDKSVLCIFCSEVDASHHIYLEMVAHIIPNPQERENPGPGMRMRIPYSLVLMIVDPQFVDKKIGFYT